MQIQRWLQTHWHPSGATGRRAWMLPLVIALLFAPVAQALEVRYSNPFPDGPLAGVARVMTFSGEVVPGDTDRLIELIRRKPVDAWHALGRVELEISGGDPGEALRLADTLAELYPHLVASSDCAGACATVWLSGAWRLLPSGRIGLQKPAKPVAEARAKATESPPPYDLQADRLRNYLIKQGLPASAYERWSATRSDRVYWLSAPEINSIGTWPPYYYQKLSARCPPLDGGDDSFHALRRCAARLVISQKAFAFDKLLAGVNDPWWNENKDVFLSAPR